MSDTDWHFQNQDLNTGRIHKIETPDYQIIIGSLGFLLLQEYIFCRVLDIRVAEIMEADAGQPRCFEQHLHSAVGGLRIDRMFRLERIVEDPF